MKRRGIFIVLEGIDGSGTTTVGRMLESELKTKGINAHYTFEPTSGPIGSLIKNILSGRIVANSKWNMRYGFDQRSVALLFAADRLDHIFSEIEPLLKHGYVVISDRYKYSSYAYQSLFVDSIWVREINRFAIEPDLIFFLDVDVDVGLRRVGRRGSVKEIYEKKNLLKRARMNYLADIRRYRYSHIIDADRTLDEVYLDIREILSSTLKKYGYKI